MCEDPITSNHQKITKKTFFSGELLTGACVEFY